jgi:hypothetical protein
VISGHLAVDGNYTFQVRIRDRAGNETVAPSDPPRAETARPHTGVAFRRLTLQGPMTVVSAGSLAHLRVGPGPRRFEFALSRLGSGRNITRDKRRGTRLRVRIPSAAHTGVYVVRLRSRGRRAVWPIVVQGKAATAAAATRQRPLVVLPAITWQGLNPYDSDLDGFGDTLLNSRSIPVERPFQGRGLPPRFRSEIVPLLDFLDRSRLAYDITTDVSLARREGPALGNATGAAIAASAIWVPRVMRDRLRAGVADEGQAVVSFGGKSLRRSVALVRGRLRDPSPARPDDLFGERTRLFRSDPPAPLRVVQRGIGIFDGVDDLFGEFSVFERSERLPAGARRLAAAGRDVEEAAFVAYRLGKGTVIRSGTPQWAGQLSERALGLEVPRVTRNIWRLISR